MSKSANYCITATSACSLPSLSMDCMELVTVKRRVYFPMKDSKGWHMPGDVILKKAKFLTDDQKFDRREAWRAITYVGGGAFAFVSPFIFMLLKHWWMT